jgi:hypothetical protein
MGLGLLEACMFNQGQAIESKVIDSKGEALGIIEEIIVHSESGRVAFAVMSFSFLDLPIMLFPIPWDAFSIDEEDHLILDIDKEKLRHAPGFARDQRPDFERPQLSRKIYHYYGHSPFWEEDEDDKSASFVFEEETFSLKQGNC